MTSITIRNVNAITTTATNNFLLMGWVNDLKTTPKNNVLDTKEAEASESIKNPTIGANTHDKDANIIMKMDAAKKIVDFESLC